MSYFDFAIIVVSRKTKDQIDLAWCQRQLLGRRKKLLNTVYIHHAILVNRIVTARKKVLAELLDINVHDTAPCQVEAHLEEILSKVGVLDLVVAPSHHVVSKKQIDLLDAQVARVVQDFAHLSKSDLSSVLLCLDISVVVLELALKDGVN